ncbi:MAG: formylglycine-generating enzyme family protein [Bryobacteraceae bacterium]|nr:formylglycine-generating enzyme family protein [Bryobacteraceae bacterium]
MRGGAWVVSGVIIVLSFSACLRVVSLTFVSLYPVANSAQEAATTTSVDSPTQNLQPFSLAALLDGTGFVRIPEGQFTMGTVTGNDDERPRHRVRISKVFYLSKFEVTQAQWMAVMADPHRRAVGNDEKQKVNPSYSIGPVLPVENLDWEAVQRFLGTLNARDPAHLYRLPTEAEWEYAARAGTADTTSAMPVTAAWCAVNSEKRSHPVGQKTPNAWGLYDMLGNVSEWVQDWYAPDYYTDSPSTDPKGPATGSYRVYRGGAWLTEAKNCRPAYRGFDLPANSHAGVGFRIVRESRR